MKKVLTILAILVFSFSINAYAIPEIEREALIALYESTDGDNWVRNDGWKTPPLASDGFAMPETECGWTGVDCWYRGLGLLNEVAGLRLRNNQLSGPIPPELGNLLFSQGYGGEINLSNNQLSGPIPPELGNLGGLGNLILSNNQLSGSIPPELGNLSLMSVGEISFDLSNNQLSGPIPPELGNLSILNIVDTTYFNLSNNQLSGPIPPELGNLYFHSPNYAQVDLSYNQLSGPIPHEFAKNIEGRSIILSNNQLTGPIPFEILIGIDDRFTVDLSHNQFSGTIPPEMGSILSLKVLYLNDNLLIGPVQLEYFYGLEFLHELNICNNFLYTDDNYTRDILNHYQPGWEDCQYALPAFNFTPATLSVTANAGSASANVSNTGGGSLHWTATVTSGGDWLSITSGLSGVDAGTVTCAYNQNSGAQRIGTIRFESLTEQSQDYQVTQAAATHTLNTSVSPSGGGAVTRSPNESTFAHNDTVQLTANPSPGYTFSHWSGDASGSSNPITVTMNSKKSVTANFVAVTYTLSISLSGSGSVVRDPEKTSYIHNESVQLTATPSSGYTFSHWSGGATGPSNPVNVTMDSNKSVTANFTALTYTLNATSNPAGGGNITRSPDKPNYSHNEKVQLTAVPIPGYAFSHWSGGASGSSNPISITMDSNKSVTANFAADIAAPTFTPDGGTQTGETVNVTVSCATPGVTIHYTTNGDEPTDSSPTVASGGAVSVPVPGTLKARAWLSSDTSTTTTAAYAGPDDRVINLSILGRGLGNLSSQPAGISCLGTDGDTCTGVFDADYQVTLTANPEPGSAFKDWSADCAGQPGNTCTLIMDANKVIEAHFVLKSHPNAIGDYLSIGTLTPAERDFLLDIGDGTKPFPDTSPLEEVRFQNDTATIHYRDGTSQVVNVKHGDGYSDDFINAVLLSDTSDHTFTTLLNLPSFDAELEFPGNSVVICYPGISPVGSGPGIEINALALLKLKPVGQPSLPFAYRVNAPADGDFWITNHLQEAILPPTHTLNPGQVVDLYLAVEDNGLYDLEDTSNVIVDPLVLGQVEEQIILPPSELSYPTTSSTGSYNVTWSASTGAVSYRLEYSTDGGNTWSLRYTGTDRSYAESVGNGSYRYRVMASDGSTDSAWQAGAQDCVVSVQTQAESGGGGGGGCFIDTALR